MTLHADYEQDYYAWITHNVALLRSGQLNEADAEHIAEELESMGKRDLRQLRSRLQVLMMHLLKWQHQCDLRGTSWISTIDHQRDEIEALLLDSPSLRARISDSIDILYPKSRRDAARETGLPLTAFPETCPYHIDEILNPDFMPEGAGAE